MPLMIKRRFSDRRFTLAAFVAVFALAGLRATPLLAQSATSSDKAVALESPLESLSNDFWQWRSRYQPFSQDDLPRIERSSGPRDWSSASIGRQKASLEAFEKRWKLIDSKGWSVPQQVDYRLLGSALARVRWELE